MPEVEILTDAAALAERAAEIFTRLADEAVSERGRFCAALSGGSTPRALYARLAQPPFFYAVNWTKVHLFWGDERCVPPEHPESNYGAARAALLDQLYLPPGNLHRIQGELEPAQAALAYEWDLAAFFYGLEASPSGRALPSQVKPLPAPRFDLILLGLGEDGHTASLFPGSKVLKENRRWVVAVEHSLPPLPLLPRVTFTPLLLNAARIILFLVSGAGKAARLTQVLNGPFQPESLPAQVVQPQAGRLLWLVDQEAAGSLTVV